MAASLTVSDEFPAHSLHAYFILAGDSKKQILFNVERTREGGSFKTRSVKAMQDNKTICQVQASFHKQEQGHSYQVSLSDLIPDVKLGDPESYGPSVDISKNILRYTIAEGDNWRVQYVRVLSNGGIREGDWKTNCCLLTFLSDSGMVSMARQPHGPRADYAMALSLDHSVHFHRPLAIRVDKWMVLYTSTNASAGARGLAQTLCFNDSHELVATITQEALIRPVQSNL